MELPTGQPAIIVLLVASPHDLILAEGVQSRDNYVEPTDTDGVVT